MGKIVEKIGFLTLVFTMISLCAAAAVAANYPDKYSGADSWCNGTIAECLEEKVELLTDSDASRRLLLQQGKATIDFTNVKTSIGPTCGAGKTYASCLPPPNPGPVNGCKTYNKCRL